MAMENFVGERIKKAWRMKPKRFAGNSSTTQGRSSDAKLKMKQSKPKDETKKK